MSKARSLAILGGGIKSSLNASGDAPIYACRAWVNFDGTLANPITPRASGNVSSVAKNGTGDYTVNFATAIVDADYSVSVFSNFAGGSGGIPVAHQNQGFLRTTTQFRFQISDANSYAALKNQSNIYVSLFR